ncbi:MAG TPA: cellulase family glycosylhydrolase [Oligoflexia bacterium]|nr:cellulase family glycosylhydrolase [Oligoflexia bacterium]HMP27198.1 cellulase family glycosylhydrolase [Oligoflexia bacterium]
MKIKFKKSTCLLPKLLMIGLFLSLSIAQSGCDSSKAKETIDDGNSVINDPPRRELSYGKLGLNAFANDGRFGSMSDQFNDVKRTLKLKFIRILIAWDNNVQPTPSDAPNFNFTDSIVAAIPDGLEALAVVTGAPSWMSSSANWVDGNPRKTFIERFFRLAVNRYGNNPRLRAFQIWNEPNMIEDPDNGVMSFEDPTNYLEMAALGANVVRERAPGKLAVSAATTAINQNFPQSLNYNKQLVSGGILSLVDIFAVHYYGKQLENVVRPGGVRDFLRSISKPIWVTESGRQGYNQQLDYAERIWPYLFEQIPGIARLYIYQHTDHSPAEVSYGLRNLTAGKDKSDLYIKLRDR